MRIAAETTVCHIGHGMHLPDHGTSKESFHCFQELQVDGPLHDLRKS